MPQYLFSVYQPDTDPPPAEVLEPVLKDIFAWADEVKAAGVWVFSGGLFPPSTATVLRAENGDVVMTDGPYLEGKEHLGGFTVIDVEDLDAALDWARKLSRVHILPLEVRPMLGGQEA